MIKTMKYIITVIQNGEDIELEVHCSHCNRKTLLFDEDTNSCLHCGHEIEQVNIDAWTEYHDLKPEVTFQR